MLPVSSPEPLSRTEVDLVTAERLTFFSDAVVAIAITLLALDLPVPDASTNAGLLHQLRGDRSTYLAFLISFLVIGNYWFAHHRMFAGITRLGGHLAGWNMTWLLMIVLTPFVTKVLTQDGAFPIRFTMYAAVQGIAAITFLMMRREIARNRLRGGAPIPAHQLRRDYVRLTALAGGFLGSIPIAFVTHWAYVCWAAVPFGTRAVIRWLDRRRPPATSPGPDSA
jgi:uncharacterized membrane protein